MLDDTQDLIYVKFQPMDHIGKKFNAWTVLEFVGPDRYRFKMKCDCGKEFIRDLYTIMIRRSKRCYHCNLKNTNFKRTY